jgi:cell wall-associated NlpC family hydrolase/regulator of replication initiation timing
MVKSEKSKKMNRFIFVLIFPFIFAFLSFSPLLAQSVDPQTDPGAQVASLSQQADTIRQQIKNLDTDLEIAVEGHNAAKLEFDRLTLELADSRALLDRLQAEQALQHQIFDDRLIAVYKTGDINFLNIILSSQSLEELLSQITYISRINEEDIKLEHQLKERADTIAGLTEQIDDKRNAQMVLEKKLAIQKEDIERKIEERRHSLQQVDAQVKQILDQEAERQRAEAARAASEKEALLQHLRVSDEVQKQVVETAFRYLGVPYVWGGESPEGMDCSGLTKYVYRQHGIDLPHNAAMQFKLGTPVEVKDLQPGDLLFWGPGDPHHVAMYIGNGKYIEAPNFDEVVCISDFQVDEDYAGARRFELKLREP